MPDRTRCPFYGFHLSPVKTDLVMFDQQGNQCAMRAGYAPCFMEMDHRPPEWERCENLNTPANARLVAHFRKRVQVFPNDHPLGHPDNKPEGMPLDQWFRERTGN